MKVLAIYFLCSASFVNLVTSSAQGPPAEHLTLTCNVTYLSPDHLMTSMPVIIWSTNLTNVDISDQSLHTDAELAYSTLNLTDVSARYCGVYVCSAMDDFTGLPSTGNSTVSVNTGIPSFLMGGGRVTACSLHLSIKSKLFLCPFLSNSTLPLRLLGHAVRDM